MVPNAAKNKLKLAGLNVQSLQNKLTLIQHMLERENIDVLCVGETWLCNSVSTSTININNYTFRRRDRTNGMQHGGVGIYHRSDLEVKRREDLEHADIEAIVIEAGPTNKKIFVCSFYRRGLDCLRNFTEFLDSLFRAVKNQPIYIVGDVNVNFLQRRNADTILLSTLFASYGAKNLVSQPTRVQTDSITGQTSRSLLDIIVTNRCNMCDGRASVPPKYSDISDHCATIVSTNTTLPRLPKKHHYSRNMCSVNIQKFVSHMHNSDLSFVERGTTQEACDGYDAFINRAVEEFFPFKAFTTTDKHLPNFTPYMAAQIDKKNELRDKMKGRFSTDEDRRNFNRQSNFVKRMSHNVRSAHITDQVRLNPFDSGHLWGVLNKELPFKPIDEHKDISIDINGTITNSPAIVARELNHHFATTGSRLAAILPPPAIDPISFMRPPQDATLFEFQPVTVGEVHKYINGISSRKSSGDLIPFRIMKQTVDSIAHPITTIINKSFEDSVVPKNLKHATVSALFKSGDRTKLNNYRPLSTLPIPAKALEDSARVQLSEFLDRKDRYKFQSAYRKSHSTEMALNFVMDHVYTNLENKKPVVLVFLDLSKAFDTISHEILLQKLDFVGVRGRPLAWMESLLKNRTQSVRYKDHTSDPEELSTGIPQGSGLGPDLFNFFMNDIHRYCETPEGQLPPQLFADDTCLIFSDVYANEEHINRYLANILTWMTANRLSLNALKTKFMHFRPSHIITNLHLNIGGQDIEEVEEFRYLGFTIQSNLTHSIHIDSIVTKLNHINSILYKNKRYLTQELCEIIVQGLVLARTSYCDTVYSQTPPTTLSKIDIAFRKILKNTYRVPLDYPTDRIYRKKFLPLVLHRQINAAKFSVRILSNDCAAYLHGMISYIDYGQRRLQPERAAAQPPRRFEVPRLRTNYLKRSIRFWAPNLLNSVPFQMIENALAMRHPTCYFKHTYRRHMEDIFADMVWTREVENAGLIIR